MPFTHVLVAAAFLGVVGLVILVLLWPGPKQGTRLLRRWGVQHPSTMDVDEAVRYLRRRRFWYPWLFVALPVLAALAGQHETTDAASTWELLGTVLLGGLLGEVFALRPARTPRREAMLVHRGVFDLVPAWALVLLVISVVGGLLRSGFRHEWLAFGVIAVCPMVVALIVALAVTRPSAGDAVVDLVLRVRSARVATGLAIALPASLPQNEMDLPSALIVVAGLAAMIAVVSPSPRVASAVG